MKDVKEEYDGDDAVSSSSHVTRFINASVQTPNKLLRMVAEEICGQSARKPHADRDFKVRRTVSWSRKFLSNSLHRNTPRNSGLSLSKRRRERSTWLQGERERIERESLCFIDTFLRSLERDLERARADHISEMENMQEKHRQTISENKKKQWVSRGAV